MFRPTTRAEYSLIAMAYLAAKYHAAETVKAHEIAREERIPLSFLERLLAQLAAAGLVISTRGPSGGHRLSRPPTAITAKEVMAAVSGEGSFRGRLAFLWERCNSALNIVLDVPLSDLAEELGREQKVPDYQI